ncbi:uncharacterized protein IWZ02DRAFT_513005, partial [Phyllosticta citriasiana]|uniref:uncharacterized protein n=1 Tax=Phyllosticta citriasiana TaxID=595635 RepID=UPI0030FDA827
HTYTYTYTQTKTHNHHAHHHHQKPPRQAALRRYVQQVRLSRRRGPGQVAAPHARPSPPAGGKTTKATTTEGQKQQEQQQRQGQSLCPPAPTISPRPVLRGRLPARRFSFAVLLLLLLLILLVGHLLAFLLHFQELLLHFQAFFAAFTGVCRLIDLGIDIEGTG